eukprot:COSAG01_NODE_8498_length_2763_cov_1.614489_1_plen_416_part_00
MDAYAAVDHSTQDGSLNVVNCDLESVVGAEWSHPFNRLVNVTAGVLNLVDVTVESESSFHIGGVATVRWSGNTDGGMNGFGGMTYPPPYFDVAPDATGSLTIANQEFSRGAGYGLECRAPFVNRSIADATSRCRLHGQTLDCGKYNSTFRVIFDNLVLRDWTWTAVCDGSQDDHTCGYYPPARGVDLSIKSLLMTVWQYDTKPDEFGNANISLASERLFNPGPHNLLAPVMDISAATIRPGPLPRISVGGWSATGCLKGCTFGPVPSGTPMPRIHAGIKGGSSPAPLTAVRLSSPSAQASVSWVHAAIGGTPSSNTSNLFVEPGHNYVLSMYMRTNGRGRIQLKAIYFRFDDSPAMSVPTEIMGLPSNKIGFHNSISHWEPVILPVTPPADAAKMVLQFSVIEGATMDLYSLSLN